MVRITTLISYLLILTQSNVYVSSRVVVLYLRCGANERVVSCVKPQNCNTCVVRGNCTVPTCGVGCDCLDGYYRNRFGVCRHESLCPIKCPPHETFSNCANPCNDCQTRGKCQFLVCNKGCDCVKGYHRDANRKCIPASSCPVTTCSQNEVYSDCGTACPATCSNLGIQQLCTDECVKGCVCKDGMVRNDNGFCVNPEECPQNNCGKDEVYQVCGSACPPTCANYGKSIACTMQCVSGCFCREGLVRNDRNQCVNPNDCSQITPKCDVNEEVIKCAKPKSCNTCEIRGNCNIKRCIEGCDCVSGYYRNESGVCISETECPGSPIKQCRPREEYYDCVPTCNNTCENFNANNPICPEYCRAGCDCQKGLVRRNDGQCVPPSECEVPPSPSTECGSDEEYYDCVPTCKNTCENANQKNPICPHYCRKGCACKKGLVKRSDGKCVKPYQCDSTPEKCVIEGEEYKECGSPCETTCLNLRFKNLFQCPQPCKPGCYCKDGLIRDSENNCIQPEDCNTTPPEKCSPDQQYYQCMPTCKRTCMTYNSKRAYCSKECIPGCFCKDGLVMKKDGTCVKPDECPNKGCNMLEQYYDCMPDCNNRCNPKDACAAVCRPGCFCREGLVLRDDGHCVKKEFCDKKEPTCDKSQQYYECIPECGNTCSTYGKPNLVCPAVCKSGCFCKPGLIMNDENECCLPELCPKPENCSVDEEYYDCMPDCYNRCKRKGACSAVCTPGCFCRKGLVHRDDGKCVKKEFCEKDEPPTCGIDEQYYPCIPDCRNTCSAYESNEPVICPAICRSGCFCKSGLVLNDEDICVLPQDCPKPECNIDEQYYECKPDCTNTCDAYGKDIVCSKACKPGCFCKDGLVLNNNNECVSPEKCSNPECKPDEQYYDCIPDCKNTCNTYGKNIACRRPCRAGCFCKPGLVLNNDKNCVPPKQCPTTGSCGDATQSYYDSTPSCKNTCKNYNNPGIRCAFGPPGCFCREGLVKRESDGLCVPPEQCEQG